MVAGGRRAQHRHDRRHGAGEQQARAELPRPYAPTSWAVRRSPYAEALGRPLHRRHPMSRFRRIRVALIAEYFTTTDSVGKAVNTSLAFYEYDKL
jgi:hypothetical protein